MVPPLWTRDLEKRAFAEGWGIFSVEKGGRFYQLQRLDETGIFETDKDAWRHVLHHANEGWELHLAALGFLSQYSPEEWAAMMMLTAKE